MGDSEEIRQMSIDNAKIAISQSMSVSHGQIYQTYKQLLDEIEKVNNMSKLNELDEKGLTALTKICNWIEKTYSLHGYVQVMGGYNTIGSYLEIIKKIMALKQYTNEEKQVLNELRLRYIKKDMGVDDLPF